MKELKVGERVNITLEAVELISDLADELEYKIEVEGANNGK